LAFWAWTRAGGWRRLQHQAVVPAAYGSPGAAYDPVSDRIVMVVYQYIGGTAVPGTWTFDGSSWRQENPASGTHAKALFLVPELGGVVAIINDDSLILDPHQIWRWTGSDWTRVAVANWPGDGRITNTGLNRPSVFRGRFVYDSSRGKLRMFMDDDPGWMCEDLLVDRLFVNSSGPKLGATWTATVREPAHAGGLFVLALAASEWSGIPFRWRAELGVYERFPLANDWLFQASAAAGLGIGSLDNTGTGSFSLGIPNLSNLIGFTFHAAAITVDPRTNLLGTITNAVTSEIQR